MVVGHNQEFRPSFSCSMANAETLWAPRSARQADAPHEQAAEISGVCRRYTSDLYVFDQVLAAREYSCLDHVQSPGLIVDCGANVGYSSAYFLSRFYGCEVVAVEPDAENFAALRKNVAPYGIRCRPIRGAVWPTKSVVSTIRANGTHGEWGTRVKPCGADAPDSIETVTIPELIQSSAHQRISILKIDIEGAEVELFRGDTKWLDVVDNIVIELHGPPCSAAFFAAIEGRQFVISRCGELTVCLSRDVDSDPWDITEAAPTPF